MAGSKKQGLILPAMKVVFLLASILILPCTTAEDILCGNRFTDPIFPALPGTSVPSPTKSLYPQSLESAAELELQVGQDLCSLYSHIFPDPNPSVLHLMHLW